MWHVAGFKGGLVPSDISLKVGRFFDVRARQFDRIYRDDNALERLINQSLRAMIYERAAALLEEVERLDAPTVLDVGCGSGVNSIAAIEAGASSAFGVDLAADMLTIAQERAAEAGLSSQCRFELGDFTTWSPSDQFDIVAALGVFDYVQDARSFFNRMADFTRKSIVASFPCKSLRCQIRKVRYHVRGCPLFLYDAAEVSSWARERGLEPQIARQDRSGFVLLARR